MELKEIDKLLLDNGVRFLPWIGKDYECGISYDKDGNLLYGSADKPGKRILVLGESHYVGEDGVKDFNNNISEWSGFTRNVLKDYLDVNKPWQRWKNTFLKFERSLANYETEPKDSVDIWNHLAFYNYVQVPLTETRMSPTYKDFEKSEGAFFQVLLTWKPDVIIVWGNRLYSNLPSESKELSFSGKDGNHLEFEDFTLPSWVYTHDSGYAVHAFPVYHPASGYAWDFWNIVIKNELR